MNEIPIGTLRSLLKLDPETGRLFWREREPVGANSKTWNTRFAGREALITDHGDGYRQGRILGRRFRAHRVVFAIHHGFWPAMPLDHVNGDPGDNRPDNLREATIAENNRNRVGKSGCSSRFCGVSWHKGDRKWHASCRDTRGKSKFLGSFNDECSAALAYDAYASVEHGAFANLNFSEVAA